MDRKALIRQYKETPRPMGVYRIHNTTTGRTLIGTSLDVRSMLNRHRAQLGLGAHRNRQLQNDWNKLGPDAFDFEVLDTISPSDVPGYDPTDDLRALEELWTDKLSPAGDSGY